MRLGFGNHDKKRSSSAFIASVSQQLFNEIQNVTSSTHRSRQASNPAKSASYLDMFKELWKDTIGIFSKNLINDDDVEKVKENLNQMMSLLLNELNKAILSNEADGAGFQSPNQRPAPPHFGKSAQLSYGPIWDFFFKHNIFEVIFLWSLSYPEYLYDLKYEQLCHYENLIGHLQATEQTNLLFNSQIHQPLFSLLNHCASHNSPLIENHMIAILNQLCVCICKNDKLLSIFFDPSSSSSNNTSDFVYGSNKSHSGFNGFGTETSSPRDLATSTPSASSTFYSYDRQQGPAKFLIFSLLIPYIHKEGSLGQQARDALLLIMQLSARNPSLAKYIVDHTDFCPILATGLSGLYSELPPKLTARENFEEIRYLQEADIVNIPALNKFINSLEFCNNVIQISHSLISNQLLQYVYHGFLVPVLAPALTQDVDLYPSDLAKLEEYTNCIDEIVTATVYLDLFLRRVNEINLQRLFLKFILYYKLSEKTTLLDTFISRINSNNKLTLITLMLFYSMIDLNSEDVIHKLILVHLMPCKHLMKSQIATLKETSFEINGLNAQAFLSLSTNYMNSDGNNNNGRNNKSLVSISSINLNEPTPTADWINAIFDNKEILTIISYIDSMRFNFIDYLKDAKNGIKSTSKRTSRWSHKYDAVVNANSVVSNNDSSEKEAIFRKRPTLRPAIDLDFEPEEFLLNLNLSAAAIDVTDPDLSAKSRRSTMNLSSGTRDAGDENDAEMNKFIEDSQESLKVNADERSGDAQTLQQKETKQHKSKKTPKEKRAHKTKNPTKKSSRNEFYVLSFDNELSETSSSEDESSESSLSSSTPSLNEPANQTPEKRRVGSTNSEPASLEKQLTLSNRSDLDDANRSKLVDFLFLNEENSKNCFGGNLNNFLDALDSYFAANNDVSSGLQIQKARRKSFNEINTICDEIVNIYNECFIVRSIPKPPALSENVVEDSSDKENFDVQATNSSSQKKMPPRNPIDAAPPATEPVENSNTDEEYAAQETDIGPFLCAIFTRLENFLCNSLQINFLITGLLARLAYYPQLLLRSFLLNQNVVMQPNIKSLMQVLTTIKSKIDSCADTYDNFGLLYLKARLCLVKRLLDLRSRSLAITLEPASRPGKTPLNQSMQSSVTSPSSNSNAQINQNPPKKKFTVDRILNIFFKPPNSSNDSMQASTSSVQYKNSELNNSQLNNTFENSSSTQSSSTNDESLEISRASQSINSARPPMFDQLFTPGLELDFNEVKHRFNGTRSKISPSENSNQEKSYEDFVQLEVDWEDLNTRNIAYSTVIYDEFIKELAAICQEHCVLTQE